MTDDREELSAALEAVEDALETHRQTLEADAEQPGDRRDSAATLRVVDEVTLPALERLAVAELETLAATHEAVADARVTAEKRTESQEDGEAEATDREPTAGADDTAPSTDDAVARVDDAIADLRDALDGSSAPEDAPGRDVLDEARDLRTTIQDEIETARSEADAVGDDEDGAAGQSDAAGDDSDRRVIPIDGSDDGSEANSDASDSSSDADERPNEGDQQAEEEEPDDEPAVDVDAELETIKREAREAQEATPAWAKDDEEDDGDEATDGEE